MTSEDEKIFDEMSTYCKEAHIREMFKEYLKRLMAEQPKDPIAFLQKQIKTDPYVFASDTQTIASKPLYYARRDFSDHNHIGNIIFKLDRHAGSILWIDSFRPDEVNTLTALLANNPPLTDEATRLLRGFLERNVLQLEAAESILRLFQKCLSINIQIFALEDEMLSPAVLLSENASPSDKLNYIVNKTLNEENTSMFKWIQKLNLKSINKRKSQIVFAGVECIPYLVDESPNFVSETLGRQKFEFSVCITRYLEILQSIEKDMLNSTEVKEEEYERLNTVKQKLLILSSFGYDEPTSSIRTPIR